MSFWDNGMSIYIIEMLSSNLKKKYINIDLFIKFKIFYHVNYEGFFRRDKRDMRVTYLHMRVTYLPKKYQQIEFAVMEQFLYV